MTSQSSRPMILRSADPGEILRVNGAFTEQFGLTSEELAARPFLDWIHPDDRKTMEQELNAGDGSLRARHRTKQDEWTFLEWRVMRNSGNAVAGDVLRSLSKKKMYGSPNSNPSPELGADKENHTSWERYYQVSDCSSSLRNDWYSGI